MQKPTTSLPSFAPLDAPSTSSSASFEPTVSGEVKESPKMTPEQELEEYEHQIFKWRFVIADPKSKMVLETEKAALDWLAQKKPLTPTQVKLPTDPWCQTWDDSEEKSDSSPGSYSNIDAWSERSGSPTELEVSEPQENEPEVIYEPFELPEQPAPLIVGDRGLERLIVLVTPSPSSSQAFTRRKSMFQSARRCEENARKRMLAELNTRYEEALAQHSAWNTPYCWTHFTARGVPMYCNCGTEAPEQVNRWEEEYPPLFAPFVLKNVKDLALLSNPQLDLYYREWCHSYRVNQETLMHFEMLERMKNDGFFKKMLEFEDENAMKIEDIIDEIKKEIRRRRSKGNRDLS